MASPALLDVCKQFEALMLQALWPSSALQPSFVNEVGDAAESANATQATVDQLFAQVFATALVAAGGIGLSAQLARKLSGATR